MSAQKFIPYQMESAPAWQRLVAEAVNPLLNGTRNIVTATATKTLALGEHVLLCNATGGAFTVNLPSAGRYEGIQFIIKKIDASANAVTIDGAGAETIDGALTVSLTTQWESRTVISDGSNWLII